MKEAVVFTTESQFRDWFEGNLSRFGIKEIFLSQETCPDYVVVMENGDYARVGNDNLKMTHCDHLKMTHPCFS